MKRFISLPMFRKVLCIINVMCIVLFMLAAPGFAQEEQVPQNVTILESRFSTTTPVVGDQFKYFLKLDHLKQLNVHPVEQFADYGIEIAEQQHFAPQEFEGRIIEQYEYTLAAEQAGQHQFSPAAIHIAGPRQNPVAALAEPVDLIISSVVDVQVVTNSPIMLGEPLELSVSVTKRKPVTLSAMPQELEAAVPGTALFDRLQEKAAPEISEPTEEKAAPETSEPTPVPAPPPLHFTLDQSQKVLPQQVEGAVVEQYRYLLAAQPEQAGEYVIPAFTITYRMPNGEEVQQRIDESTIFVLNPSTDNLDIQTDYRFLTLPAILAAALLLGGVLAFLYLKYRKPRTRDVAFAIPELPPGELAHKELAEIQAMKLPAKGEFKQYYILVSESVRKFLGAEYHFHVLERTTEEILGEIQQQDIPEKVKRRIMTFLPEADMVKFAKYIPTLEETDDAMAQALQIVDDSLQYHMPKVLVEEPAAAISEGVLKP